MGAFNDIIKPILLGLDVKYSPDKPTLEDIVNDDIEDGINKLRKLKVKMGRKI